MTSLWTIWAVIGSPECSTSTTMADADGVRALATMPSLDELRGKLVGLIASPATRVAQVLNAPAAQLARVLSAYAEKSAA